MRKIRARIQSEESGFTLIEVLVVILIIGILAAVALPAFLGQRQKGQDSSAKSNARNLVSHVESCYVDEQIYASCDTAAEIGDTGLTFGSADGEVDVTSAGGAGTNTFTVVAHSKSGNDFEIEKQSSGAIKRTCTTVNTGGCPSGGATNW